jgi:hypothetical protein
MGRELSYRDELEAAHARIAKLEDELASTRQELEAVERRSDHPPERRGPRKRRRWLDLAIAAGAGLALTVAVTTAAALRGADGFEQVVTAFTTILGPGLIMALGVLMIVDAQPVTDGEERKKLWFGICFVVGILAFEVWKLIATAW